MLRIAGANTELLGVNREVEYEANLAAGKNGIAPEAVALIRPEEYLVTRFIEGRPIPLEEIGQPENIARITQAIKQTHALSPVKHEFNSFRFVERCSEIAREYRVDLPNNFGWMMERMAEIERALGLDRTAPCLCHNDLLNANFLIGETDGKLYILDWEYAGMGDPFFDLANFSANHEFSDEQDRQVLQAYFGELTPHNEAHLKLMRIMSDLREAMWGMVQVGISRLDFDFRGYAVKHFRRLSSVLIDPRYRQWLTELQS